MKVSVKCFVHKDGVAHNGGFELSGANLNSYNGILNFDNCFAYPPLINSHDHLIGNWYPRAGDPSLYPNAHIWVKDMKESDSVKERDRIWVNSLPMKFKGNGKLLAKLGGYKNLFSGVNIVQDHAPNQDKEYYDMFPIEVIKDYRQCHSLALSNFWGGEEPHKEFELTNGNIPFIVHLGEGLDDITAKEFAQLKEMNLLHNNTLLIHGIALQENDLKECAEFGVSICWCPFSNIFLIGKTLDVDNCLKYGVNVVIGTDSTLSGSVNLLDEMRYAKSLKPNIDSSMIYKMVTENASKALFLKDNQGTISTERENDSLLLIKALIDDPYDNLLSSNPEDIVLLLHKGVPLFGHKEILDHFQIDDSEYYFYNKKGQDYFVIGHPEIIIDKINQILGYRKILPYLPFQS